MAGTLGGAITLAVLTYADTSSWRIQMGLVAFYTAYIIGTIITSAVKDVRTAHKVDDAFSERVIEVLRREGWWIEVEERTRRGSVLSARIHKHGPDSNCPDEYCGLSVFEE